MSNLSNKDKTILLAKHFGWKFVSSEKCHLPPNKFGGLNY